VLKFALNVLASLIALTIMADYFVGGSGGGEFYSELKELPRTEAALVLGTAKFATNGRPNLFYMPRLEAAARLYLVGKVRGIVVSGDNATRSYNEPQTMKKDLIKLGVPREHITCDYAGLRTLDSVVRMSRVFGVDRYTVVSQPFHVKRALYLAKSHGHSAVGFGARDVPRGYGVKVRLRETLARLMALIDVNILNRAPKFLGDPVPVGLRDADAAISADAEPVAE
jgi:SanA protein